MIEVQTLAKATRHEETRPDGATIVVWGVTCGDCGFVSGLALVTWPGGPLYQRGLCGPGCFRTPRRTVEVALAWARSVEVPSW